MRCLPCQAMLPRRLRRQGQPPHPAEQPWDEMEVSSVGVPPNQVMDDHGLSQFSQYLSQYWNPWWRLNGIPWLKKRPLKSMNIETKLTVTQTISNHCSCIFLGFPVAYQMIVCFGGGKESTTCSISVPASEDVLDIIICPYLVILGKFPASSDTNLRPATAATRLKAVAAPSDTISVTAAWRHWRGSRNGAPPSGIFTSLRDGNRPHRIVGQPLVTANDVGHWDQKHPKVLIVGKKNAKNLIAMYSGPTQFKK